MEGTSEPADNHWLDCLVGAAVAASMQGVELSAGPKLAPKRRPTLQELAGGARIRRFDPVAWMRGPR